MPVKDSIDTAESAIRAVLAGGHSLTVYNDNSSAANTARLHEIAREIRATGKESEGCRLEIIDIAERTTHPSPNYRYVLIDAREQALQKGEHLVIVESDVIVHKDTIDRLVAACDEGVGLVASVTHDEDGKVNFPYEYAREQRTGNREQRTRVREVKKRLSFCCTLLSRSLLEKIDFETELDEQKNWYDVTISHRSTEIGLKNLLMMDNAVLHKPHSSRPWKKLKYTHPLLYYWRKWTQRLDKI